MALAVEKDQRIRLQLETASDLGAGNQDERGKDAPRQKSEGNLRGCTRTGRGRREADAESHSPSSPTFVRFAAPRSGDQSHTSASKSLKGYRTGNTCQAATGAFRYNYQDALMVVYEGHGTWC